MPDKTGEFAGAFRLALHVNLWNKMSCVYIVHKDFSAWCAKQQIFVICTSADFCQLVIVISTSQSIAFYTSNNNSSVLVRDTYLCALNISGQIYNTTFVTIVDHLLKPHSFV